MDAGEDADAEEEDEEADFDEEDGPKESKAKALPTTDALGMVLHPRFGFYFQVRTGDASFAKHSNSMSSQAEASGISRSPLVRSHIPT